jgi:hypothetical protein
LKELGAFLLELLQPRLERLHFLARAFDAFHQTRVHRLRGRKARFAFGPRRRQLRSGGLGVGARLGGLRLGVRPRRDDGGLGVALRCGDSGSRVILRSGDGRLRLFARSGDGGLRVFARGRDRRFGLLARGRDGCVRLLFGGPDGGFRFLPRRRDRRLCFLVRGGGQVFDEPVHQRVEQLFGLAPGVGIKRHMQEQRCGSLVSEQVSLHPSCGR